MRNKEGKTHQRTTLAGTVRVPVCPKWYRTGPLGIPFVVFRMSGS